MAPPNIRDLVGDIREALDRFPPDALKEILTYVFKEYVVEGPAPIHTAAPTLRDDLDGMCFAEVIRSLQLRLDLPELALFEVQGERVSIKLGGRQIPVEAQASRPDPIPPPVPMAVPAAPLTSVAVAVPAAQRPGRPQAREELPLAAAPGTRGISPPTVNAPGDAQTPAVVKSDPPAQAPADEKSGRFGLLEID